MISHIFLDLDDVLCQWMEAALSLHGQLHRMEDWPRGQWDIPLELGMTDDEFCGAISAEGAAFWATLEPTPWMEELLGLAEEFAPGRWSIATNPRKDKFYRSAEGKEQWIRKHLGHRPANVFIGPDKFLLSRRGGVLIDDNQVNCQQFSMDHGLGIVFPRRHNNRVLTDDPIGAIRLDLERASVSQPR